MKRLLGRCPRPFNSGWLKPMERPRGDVGIEQCVLLGGVLPQCAQRHRIAGAVGEGLCIGKGEGGGFAGGGGNARNHQRVQRAGHPVVAEAEAHRRVERSRRPRRIPRRHRPVMPPALPVPPAPPALLTPAPIAPELSSPGSCAPVNPRAACPDLVRRISVCENGIRRSGSTTISRLFSSVRAMASDRESSQFAVVNQVAQARRVSSAGNATGRST